MAQVLYYNVMTPQWLNPNSGNKANWDRANNKTFGDLRIKVGKDTMPYERICTVPLLSGNAFALIPNNADITVQVTVGMELDGEMKEVINGRTTTMDMPTKPKDPVVFLVTDGLNAIGMVIQDVTKDHDVEGPYYGIQGTMGPTALSVDKSIGQQLTHTSAKNNPDEIRLTFKPSELWGKAYSAIDGGHKKW